MAAIETTGISLLDVRDLLDEPHEFTWLYGEDEVEVQFYDDSGLPRDWDSFFVCGREFGAEMIIHARSFEAAWETWVDESPTIPESEVPEAYGIPDEYRAEYETRDPAPPWHEREAWDAWRARFDAACMQRRRDLCDKALAGEGEYPELVEGYEHQSNSTGTGIVDMGDYAWMNETDLGLIRVVRRAEGGGQ